MTFTQSIEAPLTLKDTAVMSGQLVTHNGRGSGNLNVALRRVVSPQAWTELGVGFGAGLSLEAKGYRTLTRRTFTNVSGVVTFGDRGVDITFIPSQSLHPSIRSFLRCSLLVFWLYG